MAEVKKSYKFRIYPNNNQKELIEKYFGCCRFVYNYFLAQRKEHDRDINAAINILMEGKREKSSRAGDYTDGESVRPNSRKRKRQESVKSEASNKKEK